MASARTSLELQMRPRAAPAARAPIDSGPEPSIDLAFDPREREPAGVRQPVILARGPSVGAKVDGAAESPHDASDAWLLADYGELPRHWVLSPLYALRVLKRQRAIKRGLGLRTQEAASAMAALEDAFVGLAERIRPIAEAASAYKDECRALALAEGVLRSRDAVLLSEHDAQAARLASVDARLAKLESELAAARLDGREAATALVSLQNVLARETSNLKRAEAELRVSQTRVQTGSRE